MNAIFKVLWNKARGQFVATDETKTAFGKGKVRSTVQKGLSTPSFRLWLPGVSRPRAS